MRFPFSVLQKSTFVAVGLVIAMALTIVTIGKRASPVAITQTRPFQSIPVTTAFISGMNLVIGSAAVVRERGTQEVRFNLNNQGTEKLEMVDVLLFDFVLPNRLERVEGKRVRWSANAGQTTSIYFPLSRPVETGHGLAMLVRSAVSTNEVQDFDYLELIRDLSRKGSLNGTLLNLNFRKVAKSTANIGFLPCHSLYQLTKDLLKEKNVAPYPAFSCQPGISQFELRFDTSLVKSLKK
ncbi:MAG: hypothetical protein HOP19_14810 [Acidobacteria bacterium]|nr:hypothetical protein [Acidobacteriota bacterium]